MSPRRSSRARTTQPPTSLPSQTLSSSSSTSSGRADRSTRSHHKIQSPQKSTPSRSRSSEEVDETTKVATTEPLQTRRRKRERGEDDHPDREPSRDAERHGQADDDNEEEEEVTRCICGYQEYPGPPVLIANHSIELDVDPKLNIKDELNLESMAVSDVPSEESGGWFIQCDTCKVWQHGGCVGIMDGSMTPDDYFCEICRKDFHKITIGPNGQRSSRYLPVLENFSPEPQRSISRSKDRDSKASSNDRSNRPSIGSNLTKRRATMNSRDAAYDEQELLRRAIEESKREAKKSANFDTSSRRGKRGRSDSEDSPNHESKRQRTASMSPDPTQLATSQAGDSEDDTRSNKNSTSSGGKRVRGAAARNQREKELRDREIDKEKERADAAGRRKGRAERRRGDDSDPSDEFPLSRTASAKGIAETSSQPPDTAPSSQPPRENTPPSITAPAAVNSSAHRKTGRPPARRGRVGRNQYTKDRDVPNDGVPGENGIASPLRSQSRDGPLLDEAVAATSQTNGNGTHNQSNGQALLCPDGSKPSKPRYMHPQRTSMNEMKKRVNSILEFISRVQLDMADERTPPAGTSTGTSLATSAMLRSIGEGLPMGLISNGVGDAGGSGGDERDFSQLQTEEMMDVLTRKLILWQKEFGKYGEK